MVLTWFVYDDSGRAEWYVASRCAVVASSNGCRGTLYRTSGPAGPDGAWSQVGVNAVGTVELAFTDSSSGMLTYTVNGVNGAKAITRQLF
jgi:hypothetical protein